MSVKALHCVQFRYVHPSTRVCVPVLCKTPRLTQTQFYTVPVYDKAQAGHANHLCAVLKRETIEALTDHADVVEMHLQELHSYADAMHLPLIVILNMDNDAPRVAKEAYFYRPRTDTQSRPQRPF